MPPIKINVTGTSTIARKPERALVIVHVSSSGPDQTKVNHNVTSTATKVQGGLRQLSGKDSKTGDPLPDAAITHWSMSSLSTGSYFIWLPHKSKKSSVGDGSDHKVPNFTASTTFEIKFRDFAKLGSVCADLANVAFVQVRSVSWRLTDKTKETLAGESRALAVKDALRQAKDFAGAAGKSNVWPVEIDAEPDYGGVSRAVPFGATSRAPGGGNVFGNTEAEGQALDFQPEDVELSCTVRVKFEAE